MLAFFALLCLIVPLLVFRRQGARTTGALRLIAYFTGLGLAYMFVEVFFIQKLSLLLGHPAYAIAVTLGGMLVALGVGSGLSTRVAWRPVTRVTAAVVNLMITVTFGLRVALLSAAVIYCLALLMLRSWAGSRALAQAR
jgi:hypothetical protein